MCNKKQMAKLYSIKITKINIFAIFHQAKKRQKIILAPFCCETLINGDLTARHEVTDAMEAF